MSRTHRPLRALPVEDDFLLDKPQVAKRLGIHPTNVWRYCARWTALTNGIRVVRTKQGTDGRKKLLRSALMEHLHFELLAGDERAESGAAPVRASEVA